jgi:competence protein ComEC
MVRLAIAFLCGILAYDLGLTTPGALLACASAIFIARSHRQYTPSFALLIAGLLGTADAIGHAATSARPDTRMATLAVCVLEVRDGESGAVTVVVRLSDNEHASFIASGMRVIVGERLIVRAKRELFDVARNPGEPADRDIEAERGIAWRLVHVRIISRAPPDERDASLWLPRLRAWGSQRIHGLLGEPEATILAGAMWGERGALSPDLRSEFHDTGTVHVLVTAGLHLGVVAALALAVFSFLGFGRIASSLATIPLIWMYAELSGAHLPSVRAATMVTFALVARASGRDPFSWNALALAAVVVAAADPHAVTSLSFALSFSCVAAIFAFARPCTALLERFGARPVIAQLFGVAFATQLGTWPLTAFGFLVIAPYAPVANAAVVPVVAIAMLAGFAALIASPVPLLAHAIANIAISLVDWIVWVVRFVASLPGAHIIATPPPFWTIVAYDAALALFAVALQHRRLARPAFALVAIATCLCLWPPRPPDDRLRITAIDVGQADSLLIQTPAGHAYLVDGGGKLESGSAGVGGSSAEAVGERVVVPFLIRSGIHHLNAVLVSHPHGDHVGGIAPVLRILGANGFADSGQSYPGHAYHDALDAARERHIPLLEPRGGDVWHTDDGVTLRFYGPTAPYITGSRSDINSNSLVFRLEYKHFAMLFTGDAGSETERRLLASGIDLHADVLKVGHHGSAYGTTPAFVRAVGPKIALISVGKHNLFGHPADGTIATLRAASARIFRTDENGAIRIATDGETTNAEPFLATPR